ncbi:MAG: hypothetical protein JSS81_10330 [Acidobacteria bacterium]|nr:hypothetical protein [Acidobacteriota bacterium]
MTDEAPQLIRIEHDEYYARHIGRTADGRQFFLTNPFIPRIGGHPGREFLALYIFDAAGNLLEARIDDLGVRESKALPLQKLEIETAAGLVEKRLAELGDHTFADIEVAPFRITRDGTEFGLIAHAPNEDSPEWSVTAEPGDFMCFYPPWDGDYDT